MLMWTLVFFLNCKFFFERGACFFEVTFIATLLQSMALLDLIQRAGNWRFAPVNWDTDDSNGMPLPHANVWVRSGAAARRASEESASELQLCGLGLVCGGVMAALYAGRKSRKCPTVIRGGLICCVLGLGIESSWGVERLYCMVYIF